MLNPKCSFKNAINLSKQELTTAEQSLLQKGHSFVQNPTETLKHKFTNFVNKLRYVVLKSNEELTEYDNVSQYPTKQSELGNPQQLQVPSNINYKREKIKRRQLGKFYGHFQM